MNQHIRPLIAIAFLLASALVAQAQLNLPTKRIGNTDYYFYHVEQDATIYALSMKLGISQEDIIKYNPTAAEGMKKGQFLYFPVAKFQAVEPQVSTVAEPVGNDVASQVEHAFKRAETSSASQPVAATTLQRTIMPAAPVVNGTDAIYHNIMTGEDIYTLAKQYNTTIESIIYCNPGLEPSRYSSGETIKIQPNTSLPFTYDRTLYRNVEYKVQKNETWGSIARDNGITVEQLKLANPQLKEVKKNKKMIVPTPYTEQTTGDIASITMDDLQRNYPATRLQSIYNQFTGGQVGDEVNIAMVLPFQLQKEDPPRQAFLYTDFYKGFLLAIDSIGARSKHPIKLSVYDTQHNLNVTDSILLLPELKQMDIIIAPGEPKQLQRINKFGLANNVKVLNCFTNKNNDYLDNPCVYQVITPTSELTENVLKWFDNNFSDCHVIYLVEADTVGKEIFNNLREHISVQGHSVSTVTVSGEVGYDRLSNIMNPGTRYVFIPSSGDRTLLKNILPALRRLKKERFDCELAMLGYPEYVMYLKDFQTQLQDVDTYMFTRFFNSKGFRTRDIESLYAKKFGGEMLESIPNMGIFGFDTGMYLITTMGNDGTINADTPLYKGVQTSFRFHRANNWTGYTNQAVDIVHFTPEHQIITIVL